MPQSKAVVMATTLHLQALYYIEVLLQTSPAKVKAMSMLPATAYLIGSGGHSVRSFENVTVVPKKKGAKKDEERHRLGPKEEREGESTNKTKIILIPLLMIITQATKDSFVFNVHSLFDQSLKTLCKSKDCIPIYVHNLY